MELLLRQAEMEHLRHLGFGVAPGSGEGHRQGRREAAWREEQVIGLLGSEPGIKVEGEPVVPLDDGSHVGLQAVNPSSTSRPRSTTRPHDPAPEARREAATRVPVAPRFEVFSKAVIVSEKLGNLLGRIGRLDESDTRRFDRHPDDDRGFRQRRYRLFIRPRRDDDRVSTQRLLDAVGGDQEHALINHLDECISGRSGNREVRPGGRLLVRSSSSPPYSSSTTIVPSRSRLAEKGILLR